MTLESIDDEILNNEKITFFIKEKQGEKWVDVPIDVLSTCKVKDGLEVYLCKKEDL